MSETPFETDEDLVEKVFWTDYTKGIQYRLCISEFYDKRYFGIRKWVQVYDPDNDCDWIPTREGMNMPYELETTAALWNAMTEILSESEVLEAIANAKPSNAPSE
jgi:hypothetical protein